MARTLPQSDSWSTQQLVEFMVGVSSMTDKKAMIQWGLERIAETLEAEIVVLVYQGKIAASVGYAGGEIPAVDRTAILSRDPPGLAPPGLVESRSTWTPLDSGDNDKLVIARSGMTEFSLEDLDLLRGLGRLLSLSLRLFETIDLERSHRRRMQREIRDRERAEELLAFRALHDDLTGLPNRNLLLDRIDHALELASRKGAGVGVIFIDVDNFKRVNDSIGHAGGDKLLSMLAKRLSRSLRSTDTVSRPASGTVGRWGGDEFVLLCEDMASHHDIIAIVNRIFHRMKRSFQIDGRDLTVTVSMGVCVNRNPEMTAESMVRDADVAMYRAKQAGGDRHEIFDKSMRDRIVDRLETTDALREAVQSSSLDFFYQPIHATRDGRVVGAESLVRWFDPVRGTVPPAEFIPIAEETDLIVEIGEQGIVDAVDRLSEWKRKGSPWSDLSVSVNISIRHLRPSLTHFASETLRRAGVDPRQLTLEFTESLLIDQFDTSQRIVRDLRDLGVRIALDDFGTGYSSLSYLGRLKFDVLKLDRSFIQDIDTLSDSYSIVAATIEMATALDMTVVAEGVETPEQMECITRLGCPHAQGFLFAKPRPAHELEHYISESFAPSPGRPVP